MSVASSEALDPIRSLVEKIISPALFDTNCSFKRENTSFFDEKIVDQSFYSALLVS